MVLAPDSNDRRLSIPLGSNQPFPRVPFHVTSPFDIYSIVIIQQLIMKTRPVCGPGLSRLLCYRRNRRFRSHPQPDGPARRR